MKRSIGKLSITTGLAILLGSLGGCAAGSGELREALKERYRPSRIELQSADQRGAVTRSGTVLTLLAGGVPASGLRVLEPGRPHPKIQAPLRVRHIDNYARVTVDPEGTMTGAPAALTLASGTRLVLFDVNVERDQVRFFTHTAEPVRRVEGGSEYGCTEFVFLVPAGTSAGQVLGVVDRVLAVQAQ
jgi:hypothetical protein